MGNDDTATPPRLPLTARCWGIIYTDERIYLGEGAQFTLSWGLADIIPQLVITFYSKEARGGSKHAWQLLTTSISSLSYIAIRAYEVIGNRNSFRPIHSVHAKLRALKIFHLSSTQFLRRTQDIPTTSSSGTLSLSEKDWRTFREMMNCKKGLAAVIKQLNASMRGSG